ncbi:MAG: hypothetical protein ACXWNN_00200 [Candidatus Binataceae bacterium]
MVLAFFFLVTRPATSAAAPAAGPQEASGGQLRLPQDIGWEDWQVVREQRADRATVEVPVRKGEAPATAKVRIVLAQRPKPGFDSPEAILNTIVRTAKQQCRKVSAKSMSKGAGELIFELRGVGCAGQTGERYLLQRIAFIGQSEIEATYAPMTPTDDLSPPEKHLAIKLISSVTISPDASPAADSGWFLITPPQKADGHFDDSVPLSKWKVEEGAGSQDECERLRATLSSLALKQGQPADIEQVKAARCVSMDDPRLEGN